MKARIEKEVENNPGISFTELKESFEMANGQLQYHLRKADVVKKDKKYVSPSACKECPLENLCVKKCILGLLRDEKKKEIVRGLVEADKKSDIADSLNIDSSTLSYHLNVLRENNVVDGDSLRPEVRELEEF
ncbi:ArsR family transcriptional regulator [Candidatus Nanohalovita haloferacivicina]|uniref:ArsR family transcriptional regulator n=1 Tax=Candidatus Nanohalovita haloferacivicina TaxID=2978046 RepID=UPI00325FAC93|nr:Putative transcriptional regulator, contains twoHTH domains [Candidatus Nanohalobia archaeon BNXNv]